MADLATAYLRLIPSLKGSKKTIENELGGVSGEKAGAKVGKSFGGGLTAGIGKLAIGTALGGMLMQGVQSAANMAVDTFKTAFTNIGEFEQLKGGVEKIFNEANIAQIFDDAQRAYKELNMSANEYLASINQTGAAFAQTMGDQKGYETARTGMKAIADYASGTGRSIDELNEKFSLITRATSSYQSIADQFSGILPATSADFLAQAQAAGLLSTEYEKLTDVPIAEYQEAVSKMLEKGVADMGLADNALNESTQTLTGSIAMTKSAWQNLLTELGKPDGNISARMTELIDSIGAMAANIGPVVGNILNGIGQAVNQAVPQIANFIRENKGQIASGAVEMFTGFVTGLAEILPDLLAAVVELVIALATEIVTHIPDILTAIGTLMNNIVDGVLMGIGPTAAAAGEVIGAALVAIGGFFSDMLNAGMELVNNIGSGISSAVGAVISAVTGVIQGAVDAVSGFVGSMFEAGANIIQGLIDGIGSAIGGVGDAIMGGLQGAVDGALSFLGIASPSRLFMSIGEHTMQGMALGIGSAAGHVESQMQAAIDDVYATANVPTAQIAAAVTSEASNVSDAGAAPANIGIYLDGKILVGYLAPGMDRALVVA